VKGFWGCAGAIGAVLYWAADYRPLIFYASRNFMTTENKPVRVTSYEKHGMLEDMEH